MAGKRKVKKEKGRGTSSSDNYVVWAKDGKLFFASGTTGTVAEVKPEHRKQVERLIRQRQDVGLKLSRLLDERGYVVAVSHPTHVFVPGKAKLKKR